MKKMIFLTAFILSSHLVSANTCFKALNPQVVTISSETSDEQAKEVSVELKSVEGTPWLVFLAKGDSLSFETVAIGGYLADKNAYGVDCDGGQITLKTQNEVSLLSTDRLVGEIFSDEEGCGDGKVSFLEDVKVQEVRCDENSI